MTDQPAVPDALIERAARVVSDQIFGHREPGPHSTDIARALASAGLLADPAKDAEVERLRARESELEAQVVKQKSIAQYEANRWRQSAYLSTLQRDYERARAELRKLNEAILRRNATTLRSRREADRLLECVDELTAERDELQHRIAHLEASVGHHASKRGDAVAEREQLQHRIDAALALIPAEVEPGFPCDRIRAALQADQPAEEVPRG